jgi:drug/metabolite transporter (DMT)-like permease
MLGELAALCAAALWAVASILWTRLGRTHDAVALNLLKCVVAALFLSATLAILHGTPWPPGLDSSAFFWLGLSGLFGLTIGDSAYFLALQRLGPRKTLLIWSAAPGLSALLAWPVLGEPVHAVMLIGMALTLSGVTWVVLERSDEGNDTGLPSLHQSTTFWGLAFAAVALAGQASSNVLVKYGALLGGDSVGALEASIVRLAIGSLGIGFYLGALGRITGAIAPLRESSSRATALVAIFLGTFLGIWLMSYGVIHAEVGVAATLNSTSPLFVLPLVVWMEGEKLTYRSVLGALVAVAGVAVLFLGSS